MINLEIYSKDFIELIIDETYRWLLKQPEEDKAIRNEMIRTDFIEAIRYHLRRWNITNAQARIVVSIITLTEIEDRLMDIKTYNYNKLKIAYDHRKNQPTVPQVQDFYYERDQLHESQQQEIPGSKSKS